MSATGPTKHSLDDLRIDRDSKELRPSRRLAWLIALALLIAAGFVVGRLLQPGPTPVTAITVPEPPQSASPDTVLNASGYVTARRKATVSSKVTGRIMEVLIEEGMQVREGQVLARLDTSNVDASLSLARAQLESARAALGETEARLHQAELDLTRLKELAREKIASVAELDAASSEVQALQARLNRQQQEIVVADQNTALWTQELADRTIKAPFDGVVVAKNAQPGEMISPVSAGGGFTRTGVGTLVDMSSLEIEVDVNESYINRVHPDQLVTATLDSYPDWEIPSKVIAIIPTADRQKATVRVRIGFDQLDPRILPDMGVRVAFRNPGSSSAADSPRATRIPAGAVRTEGSQAVVWVLRDGRVERRAIRIGPEQSGLVPVIAGLKPGERILIQAPPDLADGQAVSESKP